MMFPVYVLLFLLVDLPAILGLFSARCPVVKEIKSTCPRVRNACERNSDCRVGKRCCPRAADRGCALRCVTPVYTEGCPIPLDFAMLVDTSGSISRRNFKKLLLFIQDMVDAFDISEEGTHIALVEYSTKASIQIKFNDFTGAHINSPNIKRKVQKIPHARGSTYIDKALRLASEELFSEAAGMRQNVTKVALVLTDGKQTIPKELRTQDSAVLTSDILNAAVQPLKDKGVLVISLGIGRGAALYDLLTIATSADDVYMASDFQDLRTLVVDLTSKKCPVHGNWAKWSDWTECSVTCGGGKASRSRTCTKPPPAHGGRMCPGESDESRPCNEDPCAVDGKWTEWKDWEPCSVTCGGGSQNTSRTCTNPSPANGGRDCTGESEIFRSCNESPCPVDGNWTQWDDWESCSVTCGGGTRNRYRACTNPSPKYGGKNCDGISEDSQSCNEQPCPIDGSWTVWGEWNTCSVTCGGGIQNKSRTCTNPSPAFGGKDCDGAAEMSRSCNESPCPVHGSWTEWDDWESCSVTCGGGTQNRSRTCTNPSPKYGGKGCDGISKESQSCNEQPCPIDGDWTTWGDWGTCSLTCGGGAQVKDRACTNPSPAYGGKECSGAAKMSRSCNESPCPVDGNWAEWDELDSCSVTCGGGTQNRYRACTNPSPKYGGKNCDGISKDSQSCNEQPCPIDGNWTTWGDWGTCSMTCGAGTQVKSRTCTNPSPAYGGKECFGAAQMSRPCLVGLCPVDGKWSNWDEWESCSVTCGGGTQARSRTCTNPLPQNGGKECDGRSEDSQSCNEQPCPIDGNWTKWGDWDTCSVTCGDGIQIRYRTCTNPSPDYGGKECSGESEMSRMCNESPCPVDGNWAEWDDLDSCSVTCGGGTQSRTRTCTNPSPKYGGKLCDGISEDSQSCNEQHCPIDGNWAEWFDWSPCSVTCGKGNQERSRTCTNPSPEYGGAQCPGKNGQTRQCSENPCPVDGKWSLWDNWGTCTVTCNGGTQERTRSCTNPSPAFGGAECLGKTGEVQSCNENPCPVDGKWSAWGDWTECPVTCGGGMQKHLRTCTNPPPAFGGAECPGESEGTQACNNHPCPGDGNWSDWSDWGKCTVTCAGGKHQRSRTCTNPPPSHGGRYCPGDGTESRSCNEDPCPVDGKWTTWSKWDECTVTCGGGTQSQSRTCTNPLPAYGGAECTGESEQERSCNENSCPVDGNWSKWNKWNTCTVKCGGGTQDRSRTCTNPSPAHGGKECPGKSETVRSCNEMPCSVDGNWTKWSDWDECTVSCGGGTQERSRTCTDPRPAHGGRECLGEGAEYKSCNEATCPVDGQWSQWSQWNNCPVTCGTGEQRRQRTCTNPPPAFGGSGCVGQSNQLYICDRGACPVDGNWTSWNNWSRCTAGCGGGTKRRFRSCTNPRPSRDGKQCPGDRLETVKCNTDPCAVNGQWGRWGQWSACSRTCGGIGRKRSIRKCDRPPPTNGGRDCGGRSSKQTTCARFNPCTVSCNIPLDFAILVDTSGSISRRNFKLLLRFIQNIVKGFSISEDGTHVAIIEYSTRATIQLKFNDLRGRQVNKYNVNKRVNDIPHQRGYTYIDKALILANEKLFKLEAGMRADVKKVALVLTDGEQTVKNTNLTASEILEAASRPLKEKGVSIITLAIGRRTNEESLRAISSTNTVYKAATFGELRQLVKSLKKGTCPVNAAGYVQQGK